MEKDLVEYIAKTLVDEPSGVMVNQIDGEKSTILGIEGHQWRYWKSYW
jgi:predicted RNA-binding protein YlqC (UPF0109 family)